MKYTLPGLLLLCGLASAQQYRVVTIAGTSGSPGWSGDNGPALSAQFTNPIRISVDSQGNLYITDYTNQSVRKVDANTGIVDTIAGNGTLGFSGDGSSAVGSQLADPHDVVKDSAGNIYIADTLNGRVRRIDTTGTINTFAGNGTRGYSGDNGPAVNAALSLPTGLALDQHGNLYIADFGNATVRKVDPNGTITTVAGVGFSTIAAAPGDGGPATAAVLEMPYSVQVDSSGAIYIGDTGNSTIRRVDTNGIISTFVQNFPAQNFALDSAGAIYFANYQTNTVEKVTTNGTRFWVGGNGIAGDSGDGGLATAAQFNQPYGVAIDKAGNIYVADATNAVIREMVPIPFSIGAVGNAASNQTFGPPISGSGSAALSVSPGEIVVLFGNGLGPANIVVNTPVNGAFGTQLAGTTVLINGTPAPIIYTSAAIVSAIVPYSVSGLSSVSVVVSYNGKASAVTTLPVGLTAPGIFTADATGSGQAAALNQDGSLNNSSHPAAVGSTIVLYVTGEGQTSPAGVDGKLALAPPYPAPLQYVNVTIGGLPAAVAYAGAAPTLVAGVMQVNVQIPSGVPSSNSVPVVVNVGGVASPAVTIAVANQ
ncbi:MAG TPA: IPT/TIG domain-containing protein [Bryobacteraceae bacterium]|nr:IPT/TIG domain-containing protein [Bryobacteraceae bacterium]